MSEIKGLGRCFVVGPPLDLPAAVVVVMRLHVLHRDPAPHADHKGLDLALVLAAGDAEITVLPPVLAPGVCSNLKKENGNFFFSFSR